MQKWLYLLVVLGIALALAPVAAYGDAARASYTVRLGQELGRSVGVFSQRPEGWETESSRAVLVFGNYTGPRTGATHRARTCLYFPFTLPAGATVRSATLKVYVYDWPFAGSAQIGVYRLLQDWNEDLTWNSRPAADETPVAVTTVSSTAGWVQWEVGSLVAAWQKGTAANHGLMLAGYPSPESMSGNGWAAAAYGRTAANSDLTPVLTIRYTRPSARTWGPGDVPEPGTMALLLGGLGGLAGWMGWRRRKDAR